MPRRCVRLVLPEAKQGALRERCPEPGRFAIAIKTWTGDREYVLWLCREHRCEEDKVADAFCDEMAVR